MDNLILVNEKKYRAMKWVLIVSSVIAGLSLIGLLCVYMV